MFFSFFTIYYVCIVRDLNVFRIYRDLKDKWMAFDFIEKIRDQKKFDSEKDLAEQIANDCRKAKNIIESKRVSD